MGDMADFTLELASNEEEHYQKFRDAPLSVQYEEGLIDEYGNTIGIPESFCTTSIKTRKRTGVKKCPKCKGGMHLVNGQYGEFYGCDAYPRCNGNRNIK